MEITKDKITEIFCIINDFCKEYDAEIEKMAGMEIPHTKYRVQGCLFQYPLHLYLHGI